MVVVKQIKQFIDPDVFEEIFYFLKISFDSRDIFVLFLAITSSILFLIGLLLCQNSGEYWLQLFDSYSLNLALLWIALFHLIGMNFFYGTERYCLIIV